MTQKVTDILDRNKSLSARRDVWLPIWQQLADLLYPNRGGFVSPLMPGHEAPVEIYDNTPMQARRGLASILSGLLKPSTSRWFWMKSKDPDIPDDDEQIKFWFDMVGDRMWSAIYNPEARFVQHSGAVDNDLAAFGIGYLWISENRNRNGLTFRSLHIGDCAIDENADGQIDTIYITRKFTARQAQQRFRDKTPPKVKEALEPGASQNLKDKQFEFIQAVYPREDADPRYRDNRNMPFANCIVSKEDETIVEESGFHEFPVAIPRWEVSPGEIYPRSPGMVALPDARTLQAMGRTLLIGGQRAVDPPTWVADDAALSAVRTHPGGLTVVDAEAVRLTNGRPIGQLDMGTNVPVGREMQQDYRQMVEAAFFRNVFNLPIDANMTATEVMERKEEFLRTIGPTLGQLENDYVGVIVRRVFGLMMRAGQFLPPPDVLVDRDVEFEFQSPVQQAKRQVEAAGMARAFEMMAPVIQLQPETADNIDGDEIVRDAPDMFATPQKYIRSKEEVAEIRGQRQQAVMAQGALSEGQQLADMMKSGAQAGQADAQAQRAMNDAA